MERFSQSGLEGGWALKHRTHSRGHVVEIRKLGWRIHTTNRGEITEVVMEASGKMVAPGRRRGEREANIGKQNTSSHAERQRLVPQHSLPGFLGAYWSWVQPQPRLILTLHWALQTPYNVNPPFA